MLSSDNYTHGGSQGYNRYTYAMNNPLRYTDPSGQVIVPAVIAAVGGAINLWSNWHNVTGVGTAFMYFGAGAVGALAPNPYLGSAITTLANRAIALATGKLPQTESIGDFLTNTGLEVGKGMATVFGAKLIAPLIAPHLQKLGNLIKDKASYFVSTSVVGDLGFKKLGESITDGLEATADFVVTATRRGSPAYLQLANGGRLGARKAFAMMMEEGEKKAINSDYGRLIGWGEGQKEGVQKTIGLVDNLTQSQVQEWAEKGLPKSWIQRQLEFYSGALTKAGKLKNEQLVHRENLMKKILELWDWD